MRKPSGTGWNCPTHPTGGGGRAARTCGGHQHGAGDGEFRGVAGALPAATALAQARGVHRDHQAYRDACRPRHGDGPGTRALIDILLAHCSMPAATLIDAMEVAVITGVLAADAIIIDARRAAVPAPVGPPRSPRARP